MDRPLRVVHYLNQFFGGIGAEEAADVGVTIKDGPVGPGMALQKAFGQQAKIVATIICGDNYFSDEKDKTVPLIVEALKKYGPDVVVAGPAFDAGRYGFACAEVCAAAQGIGIPTVTAMTPDNSGVLTHGRELVVVPTGSEVVEMVTAIGKIAPLALKLGRHEELGSAVAEGYLPRGIRKPWSFEKTAAERAFDMLEARVLNKPWKSEILFRDYEVIPPVRLTKDLAKATIALLTTGGVVPKGNPDRLEQGRTTERYHKYSIAGVQELDITKWESVHNGFNSKILNTEGPDYALPVRAARELEKQGVFKSLFPYVFSTVGNGMRMKAAKALGVGIALELKQGQVDAALLVAT